MLIIFPKKSQNLNNESEVLKSFLESEYKSRFLLSSAPYHVVQPVLQVRGVVQRAGGGFSAAKGTTAAAVSSQEGKLPLLSSWRPHRTRQTLAQLSPSLPPLCALLVHHFRLPGYQDSTRSFWVSQISLSLRYQSTLSQSL